MNPAPPLDVCEGCIHMLSGTADLLLLGSEATIVGK